MAMRSAIGNCLICKHYVSSNINIFRSRTNVTSTLLSAKLSRIVETPIEPVRNVSQDICRTCLNLLNQADDCECRLMALVNEIKLKYRIPFTIDVRNRLPVEPPAAERDEEMFSAAPRRCRPQQQRPAGVFDSPGARDASCTRRPRRACAGNRRGRSPSQHSTDECDMDQDDGQNSDVSEPDSDFGLPSGGDQGTDADFESEQELDSEPQTQSGRDSRAELNPELEVEAEGEQEREAEVKQEQAQAQAQESVIVLVQKPGQVQQTPSATRGSHRRVSRPRKQSCYGKPDPFSCDVCGEKFYSDARLAEHCDICPRISPTDFSEEHEEQEPSPKKKKRGPRPRSSHPIVISHEYVTHAEPKKPLSLQEKQIMKEEKWKRNREAQEAALADIRAGFSVREAAERHGVKRTTLQDRVSGRFKPGTVTGRPKAVSDEAEARIAAWLLSSSSSENPVRGGRLLSAVRSYLIANNVPNAFKDNMPSTRWLQQFLLRKPEVAQRIQRKPA